MNDSMGSPSESANLFIESSRRYHALGWSIIRIQPGDKKAYRGWKKYQTERASVDDLQKWYEEQKYGMAVVFGTVSAYEGSELVCRDFDSMEAYESWARDYPQLASILPTAATGRSGGGRHVYCLASSTDIVAARKALGKPYSKGAIEIDLGELRIGASYCVLPPSLHPSGGSYGWIIKPSKENLLEIDLLSSGFFSLHTSSTSSTSNSSHTSYSSNSSNSSNSVHKGVAASHSVDYGVSLGEGVEAVLKAALPTNTGQRNNLIWPLVMGLKGLEEWADKPATKLLPIVKKWHEMVLEVIGTKEFAHTARDFIHSWESYDPDRAFLRTLKTQAEAQPLPEFEDHGISRLRQVAALCRELQHYSGAEGTFFLSCRKLGQLFGVTHKTASDWLDLLVKFGVLELVRKGQLKSRHASVYRYLGEL